MWPAGVIRTRKRSDEIALWKSVSFALSLSLSLSLFSLSSLYVSPSTRIKFYLLFYGVASAN